MGINSEILARVLDLEASERAELAHHLLLSLEPQGFEAEDAVRSAWNDEIDARIGRADARGDGDVIDWRDAVERIRRKVTSFPPTAP